MQLTEHQSKEISGYPKPDRLKGATVNIIELLGKARPLWKHDIVTALGQFEPATVKSALHRLHCDYFLVQRDEFNLFSLTDIGRKYFELMYEEETAPSTTTTTTNSSAEKEIVPAQESQIQARSISGLAETDSRQLYNSSTLAADQLQISSRTAAVTADFDKTWVTKHDLGKNHPEFTLEKSPEGLSRVVEAGSGSSGPIGRSRRTFFEPLNGGERRSFEEAIKDWTTESSPSEAEVRIVQGLKDYLLSQNKVVTKLVASEDAAAKSFGLSLEEFREAWRKLYGRRQVCFGTFSGQTKIGFLLEWTDLLRHGMWRREN